MPLTDQEPQKLQESRLRCHLILSHSLGWKPENISTAFAPSNTRAGGMGVVCPTGGGVIHVHEGGQISGESIMIEFTHLLFLGQPEQSYAIMCWCHDVLVKTSNELY